jgi:aryl-phospho-beta-D-glucosidase BglC (GH1 family)
MMAAADPHAPVTKLALIPSACSGHIDVTGIWAALCAGGSPPRICSGTAPMALRGLNWFGFETGATLPDGLWAGPTAMTLDFITILRRIKLLGFNTIRLPMSLKVGDDALINRLGFCT